MKQRTPQEKKSLSYAKDRRNIYGENDKASRKNIPLRKAKVNRGYRKKVGEVLRQVVGNIDLEKADLLENKARDIRKADWKKYPDAPLSQIVEEQIERRINHAGNGKTARQKAREFVANLKIETEQETDGRWIAEAKELSGVLVYGETREKAISRCERLAQIVFLENLGAIKILEVNDDYTSVEVY